MCVVDCDCVYLFHFVCGYFTNVSAVIRMKKEATHRLKLYHTRLAAAAAVDNF